MRPLTLLAAFCATIAACSAQSFIKAQFIFFRDVNGKSLNPPKQLTVTDKAELAKIAKLLPALGYNQGGLKPGGWDAWASLRLMRPKGPGLQVFFPISGKIYSVVGKTGDFPAAKGFLEYIQDVEKRAKQ